MYSSWPSMFWLYTNMHNCAVACSAQNLGWSFRSLQLAVMQLQVLVVITDGTNSNCFFAAIPRGLAAHCKNSGHVYCAKNHGVCGHRRRQNSREAAVDFLEGVRDKQPGFWVSIIGPFYIQRKAVMGALSLVSNKTNKQTKI